jgi:hypothetical protein
MTPQVPYTKSFTEEWGRRIVLALNVLVSGYPFPLLDADPSDVGKGFTYFNTVSNQTRQWNGAAWQVL